MKVASSEDIADAVLRKLPKSAAPPIPPTTTAQAPYVNPLRDPRAKWNLTSRLVQSVSHIKDCSIIIVRLQETYPEDFAADLKVILNVSQWPYTERFAQKTIAKGITFRALYDVQKSKECAEFLDRSYTYSALNRKGDTGTGGLNISWYDRQEAPDYLINCSAACVEVNFGNEDTERGF
jgi:hypothetical protein